MESEVRERHPKGELIWSRFGIELICDVVGIARYRDQLPEIDPVEAAFTAQAR